MTKDQANELKVGTAVLVCMGLGLWVALQLSDWDQWFEVRNTLTFKVPYQAGIGGIKTGWPVTIGGVTVGSVEEIWLKYEQRDPRDKQEETDLEADKSEANSEQKAQKPVQGPEEDNREGPTSYSYFRFTVPSKYELYEDCKLTPSSELIGGAGELIITDLGSQGKLLQDGDEVFRKDLGKTGMATVMDKAQLLMDRAQSVIAKAQNAMDTIGLITDDLKHVSGDARETMSLSKPQLERIIANVRAASEEMKQGMREIRWNPWRLLHNPTDRELRTQNLLTAARAFSSGASDLDAAAGRLEGLIAGRAGKIASDDPDLIEIIEQLKATIARFSQAEKTFFKRLGKGK